MPEKYRKRKSFKVVGQLSATAMLTMALGAQTAAGQDPPQSVPESVPGSPAILLGRPGDGLSFTATGAATGSADSGPRQGSNAFTGDAAGSSASSEDPGGSVQTRRITLEQVKQQSMAAASPFARLGELSIEAAKLHRLGVQADYFPKLGATVANLHFSEFLGQVLSVHRPLAGTVVQVPIPLFSQNQTIAALTFVQPITPLFKVYQAVQVARADERIAMAKAGMSVVKNRSNIQIEETYLRLLIAQRRLMSAELKLRGTQNRPVYATVSSELPRAPDQEPELLEAKQVIVTAASEVSELTASLNRVMGWSEDTKLELVPPAPLVENISLEDVADKSAGGNLDVVEARETVVKAHAAAALSKLEYVPTVAAVSGFVFQNTIPLVPSTFGYGGLLASYTLFDFGKRERAVREARAQLGMAEIGLQLTKAKVAANVKTSYVDLQRSRQLSQLAQKMGSSVVGIINVSSAPENIEMQATRAKLETEMLEADLAHRQAFARLKDLMGVHP